MPHIGCGADILRWRREKELERRKLVALGILKEPEVFKPCRNPQFPHKTALRDPDVFNTPRKFSWSAPTSPPLSRPPQEVLASSKIPLIN